MVGGAFSRVILGRRISVMFKNLFEHNHRAANDNNNNIKAPCVGVLIVHKPSLPPLLLHSYSRCFSVCPTNNDHISKGLSDESDSEPGSRYDHLFPDTFHRVGCLAKPLIQIFSAHIHTNFGDESKRPCEIYGSIQAIEEQGAKLNAYDRNLAHPEPMIFDHGILTINSPKRSFIACNVHFDTTLDVCIKDKTQDMVVVKGKHVLHSKAEEIEDSCDKLINAVVRSEHGFLSLYYTIFRFGVVANVAVKILKKKKHNASCSFVNVHGSIIAGYANAEKYCSTNDEARYMKTSLFSKPVDQPVLTLVDTYIELSRCAVVVPSYSTLKIQVQLSDAQGQFVSGCAEFSTDGFGLLVSKLREKVVVS